jgi:hypothetical protein
MLNQSQAVIACTVGGLTILAALVGYVRWARPGIKQAKSDFVAARDSIVGRDAVKDSITGREIEPALPGIGVRMAANERNLGRLTDAVAQIAQSHARLENHEERIVQLEAGAVERVMSKAESAAAWRAIAAVAGEPDEAPEDN